MREKLGDRAECEGEGEGGNIVGFGRFGEEGSFDLVGLVRRRYIGGIWYSMCDRRLREQGELGKFGIVFVLLLSLASERVCGWLHCLHEVLWELYIF